VAPRQLGPVGLLAAAAAAAMPWRLARLARGALAAYCGALAIVAARTGGGWRTFVVLATIHASWGAGLVAGFFGLASGADEPDL
jgi:ribose/xylose/arabinose/galactoside ABC-type transport system permease subunit